MVSEAHTKVILQAINEKAAENGVAWWHDVGPVLETYGLDFDAVATVRDRGLIERSREKGLLRLTPAGRARLS